MYSVFPDKQQLKKLMLYKKLRDGAPPGFPAHGFKGIPGTAVQIFSEDGRFGWSFKPFW